MSEETKPNSEADPTGSVRVDAPVRREPYFSVVLRLDPDATVTSITKTLDALPGVATSILAWGNLAGDRDALQLVLDSQDRRLERYRVALERLRDCDWVISLPDRMDAVRQIAREALDA